MPPATEDTEPALTHPDVRALAWCLLSPALFELPGVDSGAANESSIDSSCTKLHPAALAHARDWLRQLDRHPAELAEFLHSESDHRLGARFERLMEFWFQHSPHFELLHRRLQWGDQHRTLGEFDFLVRNLASGRVEHWEVAAKFYLGVPGINGETANALTWVGPGKRDSLKRKRLHMSKKQLVQSLHRQAKRCLEKLGIESVRSRAFIKGRLFYPLVSASAMTALGAEAHTTDSAVHEGWQCGPHVNPEHLRGMWCDFDQFREINNLRYFLLPKNQWLDDCPPPPTLKVTADAVCDALQTGPVCVEIVGRESRRRCFVVKPGWFDDMDSD